MIAFNAVLAIRWMVILSFNDMEVFYILGDVSWTLGLMGYSVRIVATLTALITIWYLSVKAYCEFHGQTGFLYDLTVATQLKSDHTVALVAKTRIIYNLLVVNLCVGPYILAVGVIGLCTWNAYATNH